MNAVNTTIVDFTEATRNLARSAGYAGNSPTMLDIFRRILEDTDPNSPRNILRREWIAAQRRKRQAEAMRCHPTHWRVQ